jgi:hypothetical protein
MRWRTPTATSDYLSTAFGPTQLHVTFAIAPNDLDSFVEQSGLVPLTSGAGAVAHASPLWDPEAPGERAGSVTEFEGLTRTVEIVEARDSTTVRLVITPAA